MKINQPVTQREIPFPRGEYIVSKTDLKGIITYVNDVFIRISGFSREELIGKNHNIVRHPDMPPAAYRWLWDTLKEGKPWTGIVKNRAKNGDHYWVSTVVSPIREQGQIIGYVSIRSEPTRQQIADAEALYPKLMGLDRIPSSWRNKLPTFTLTRKVAAISVASMLFIAAGTFTGHTGIEVIEGNADRIYSEQMVPAWEISRTLTLINENRSEAFAAAQHAPDNKFFSLHDHPLDLHVNRMAESIKEIEQRLISLGEFARKNNEPEIVKLVEVLNAYLSEGTKPAFELFREGKIDEGNLALIKKLNPAYFNVKRVGEPLMHQLLASAKEATHQNQKAKQMVMALSIGGGAFALLVILGLSIVITRRLSLGMNDLKTSFARMAEGNLSEQIDITRKDEIGDLLHELCNMQSQIKAMLDEVNDTAKTINERSGNLTSTMTSIAAQSSDQSGQAHALAAAAEEFSRTVASVAENARAVAAAANKSQSMLAESNAKITRSVDLTGKVVASVKEGAESVSRLDVAVRQIGEITGTIKGIADQTNLLALNAAIEAARAGEQGRGFAVVADEVRKLAALTADSTASIAAKVDEFASIANEAVKRMDAAVGEVEQGINIMRSSVSGLDSIASAARETDAMANSIASATEEQATAGEEISGGIERISEAAGNNESAVHSAEGEMRYLAEASQKLRSLVRRFGV